MFCGATTLLPGQLWNNGNGQLFQKKIIPFKAARGVDHLNKSWWVGGSEIVGGDKESSVFERGVAQQKAVGEDFVPGRD